ncbi:MAG: LPS export ABC transporter periplasmic protein LptC [Paludibacter sp.]|nr:LPS export ABC transporter periplasmic protein LptC [Paludibacter sp.]MDD4198995.1 LPS export ABC transporter periplasmic protein LptC [Paludibacter sp.]MDD4426815.1 LPS export ABC transporter periplasmic protein LptC [Paludibacter sp.]
MNSITTAFWVVVVLFLLFSCQSNAPEQIDAVLNRAEIPRLHSLDVTTVISDSGITRYRINTPQWDIFDKSSQPYWEFPYGVHFERFDEQLVIDANIHCEYAKFLEHDQIWELKGNVRATNIQGELFETEQLFWNQKNEKIYSDSLIKITQENYIIIGKGFESNQEMTKYQVKQTQGIIPVND